MLNRHFIIYREVDKEGLNQLRRLQGEFRRSSGDKWFVHLLALIFFAGGGSFLQAGYQRFQHFGNKNDLWSAAEISMAFLLVGAYILRRSRYWYRFAAGKIQLLSGSGKVLWEESLTTIESASLRRGSKSNDFLILRWPHSKHYVEVYSSLENALVDPDYFTNDESEQESRGYVPDVKVAVGVAWICKHCGEKNPGEFEICWKCQSNDESSK